MAFPDEYNPFFHVEQGLWCQKDILSQGFLGSASRIYIEFGGTYTPAVASDIGKTVKDDDVYCGTLVGYWNSAEDYLNLPSSVDPEDPTSPTWWLIGYYPIASGSTITIPSGTGGGVTNADWATQPGGGANMCGHGLNGIDDPPKMVLSSAFLGFDRYYYVDIEGNLVNIGVKDIECETINGGSIGGITEKGSDSTDGSGDCTVTFDEEFDEVPLVQITPFDASGRMIAIVVTAKSTTEFTVKAKLLETHKHKVGQASATGTPPHFAISDVSAGTPSGSISNESAHTHGIATENQSQTSGVNMPGGTETVPSTIHTHVVGTTLSINATTVSLGYQLSFVGGYTTGVQGGSGCGECDHYHGFTNAAVDLAHSHGSHGHTGSGSGSTGYPSGTVDVASSGHSHTVQAHNHGGVTYSNSGHSHTFTGNALATHGHTLTYSPSGTIYVRNVNLRNEAGDAYGIGATLENEAKTAVDLYTESTAAVGVEVNFDYLAIPA